MFAVDTNVLLYAADESGPDYERARSLLESWRRQASPWYVTWSVFYEFMRVAGHPRVFRRPWPMRKTLEFVEAMTASESLHILSPTPRHQAVLRQVLDETRGLTSNQAHDLHIAVTLREHGITRIVTRDRGFQRFPFLEVVDPFEGDAMLVRDGGSRHYGARSRPRSPVKQARRRARGARS